MESTCNVLVKEQYIAWQKLIESIDMTSKQQNFALSIIWKLNNDSRQVEQHYHVRIHQIAHQLFLNDKFKLQEGGYMKYMRLSTL